MFELGDHLGRAKGAFNHEAIYLGALLGLAGLWVVQNTPENGVHVATFDSFAAGQDVSLLQRPTDGRAVAERATALRGRKYALFSYNCQDFCRDALFGVPSSPGRDGAALVALFAAVIGGGSAYAARLPMYDPYVDRYRNRRGRFVRR